MRMWTETDAEPCCGMSAVYLNAETSTAVRQQDITMNTNTVLLKGLSFSWRVLGS
jgi:hypothetical protein